MLKAASRVIYSHPREDKPVPFQGSIKGHGSKMKYKESSDISARRRWISAG